YGGNNIGGIFLKRIKFLLGQCIFYQIEETIALPKGFTAPIKIFKNVYMVYSYIVRTILSINFEGTITKNTILIHRGIDRFYFFYLLKGQVRYKEAPGRGPQKQVVIVFQLFYQ